MEIKRALLDYLFTHTDCTAVEATPNIQNQASIKMQQAVGGVCVGSGVFEFPETMQATQPVEYFVYLVYRQDWFSRAARTVRRTPELERRKHHKIPHQERQMYAMTGKLFAQPGKREAFIQTAACREWSPNCPAGRRQYAVAGIYETAIWVMEIWMTKPATTPRCRTDGFSQPDRRGQAADGRLPVGSELRVGRWPRPLRNEN